MIRKRRYYTSNRWWIISNKQAIYVFLKVDTCGKDRSWIPLNTWYFISLVLLVRLSSVHTWNPGTVPEYGTRWALMWRMWTHSTHARIWARCRCPSTKSWPCTRAKKWAPGTCVHTIFVGSGKATAFFSLLSSCFKMASDRAKWGNYIHSHISGTQSVNTAPFIAGTQVLVPEHQLWTAPMFSFT